MSQSASSARGARSPIAAAKASIETGVPVAFGVLTVDTTEQAEARVDKGADAARAALEMADLFAQVGEQAKSG